MSDRCRVVVGRLVAHPCALPSKAFCLKCRLPVCERHLGDSGDGRCRVVRS